MKYQFSTKDIGFNTNSAQVEAYRRALEIRQFVLERDGVDPRLAQRRKETFCWETPLDNGGLEVETVTIDQTSSTVTYIRSQIAA
jgi:hypothetical protein